MNSPLLLVLTHAVAFAVGSMLTLRFSSTLRELVAGQRADRLVETPDNDPVDDPAEPREKPTQYTDSSAT